VVSCFEKIEGMERTERRTDRRTSCSA